MKTIKFLLPLLAILTIFASCDKKKVEPQSETDGLKLVQTLDNDQHRINLYAASDMFYEGYNRIYVQVLDSENKPVVATDLQWSPIMQMMSKEHACPFSEIKKTSGKESLHDGYIVFSMPDNEMEKWTLTINYTVAGQSYSVQEKLAVHTAKRRRVVSFTGTDSLRYLLAMVAPESPEIGMNDMVLGLFKMQNMHEFPVVENYTIAIDPRMPSMGNHGAPNNTELLYAQNGFYEGDINFTMTGYWKVNLILKNTDGTVIKGEEVTEENESSSLFLEVEF